MKVISRPARTSSQAFRTHGTTSESTTNSAVSNTPFCCPNSSKRAAKSEARLTPVADPAAAPILPILPSLRTPEIGHEAGDNLRIGDLRRSLPVGIGGVRVDVFHYLTTAHAATLAPIPRDNDVMLTDHRRIRRRFLIHHIPQKRHHSHPDAIPWPFVSVRKPYRANLC